MNLLAIYFIALTLIISFISIPTIVKSNTLFVSKTPQFNITLHQDDIIIETRLIKKFNKDSFLVQNMDTKEWLIVPIISDEIRPLKPVPHDTILKEQDEEIYKQLKPLYEKKSQTIYLLCFLLVLLYLSLVLLLPSATI